MSKTLESIQLINKIDLPIIFRNFLSNKDSMAWLTLNNRAFKDHPEQGN